MSAAPHEDRRQRDPPAPTQAAASRDEQTAARPARPPEVARARLSGGHAAAIAPTASQPLAASHRDRHEVLELARTSSRRRACASAGRRPRRTAVASRDAMILAAVTGPIPGSVSSSLGGRAVQVDGPDAPGRRRSAPGRRPRSPALARRRVVPRRHADLVAVLEDAPRGSARGRARPVSTRGPNPPAASTRSPTREPAGSRKTPGSLDRPDDLDDDERPRPGRSLRRAGVAGTPRRRSADPPSTSTDPPVPELAATRNDATATSPATAMMAIADQPPSGRRPRRRHRPPPAPSGPLSIVRHGALVGSRVEPSPAGSTRAAMSWRTRRLATLGALPTWTRRRGQPYGGALICGLSPGRGVAPGVGSPTGSLTPSSVRASNGPADPPSGPNLGRTSRRRDQRLIAVIGAARPAAPAGDPLGDVEHGRDPGLVVGEVDDDDPVARRRNRFRRPGETSAVGRKSASPSRTWSSVAPRPRAPPAAASAFATLWRARPPSVIGTRPTSTIRSSPASPVAPRPSRRRRARRSARPPPARRAAGRRADAARRA